MEGFSFNRFLKENKLTAKELVRVTGYNKNTFTKWQGLKTDAKISQDFILCILREYPHISLEKYFPTHAEIIKLATN